MAATNSQLDKSFQQAERWKGEAETLRQILLDCGLTEELKWGKPCYSFEGGNIAIIQRMKDHLALMFFKGTLLDDPGGLLHAPGPNSRHGRRLHFTSAADVSERKGAIQDFVKAAIEAEKAGLELDAAPEPELPDELVDCFDADPDFRAAFEALTPGRQRGYILHFSGARKSETRTARIEKHRQRILDGKGMHDR